MTDRYARSTDGNNGDDGSTWALAKATLAGLDGIDTVGDRLFLSQSHNEVTATSIVVSLAGSYASPSQIICGNDGAEPPTAVALTAVVSTSGGTDGAISISGQSFYMYGISFQASASVSHGIFASATASASVMYEKCDFILVGSVANQVIGLCSGAGATAYYLNCDFRFGASSHSFAMSGQGVTTIVGGSVLSGGTSPDNLFKTITSGSKIQASGFDMSNCSSTINLVSSTNAFKEVNFVDCKLPASWTGSPHNGALPGVQARVALFNCDSGDTNYKLWIETKCGSVKDESTLVRTGGASDGTTTLSWKCMTGADAEYPHEVLATPELIAPWNDSVGSSKTVTVEILHDPGSPGSLNDDEIWLEVQYLGTSGVPLGSFISDAKADVLAAAAPQASSSETWTTTGMSNPTTQKLSVTFTPQEKGVFIATVKVAKASYTVYVDPKATVT